ncbi:MFS transporter [Aneurinibacillus sp. Ricciae_BoGa-3]|uniref:MFS transporter n=1 Tax=Aneurinibacillus sp. Ricciae_BoGa-3 TaxID=3022697 RepID=UPI00234285C8|nr:MFS transporter [Aneurinibacillus sp. Ricciae_BoGa-3]WCK53975.1 MFS transporter [Aneurinibacillus sp. Ricciae_BoGa-3]
MKNTQAAEAIQINGMFTFIYFSLGAMYPLLSHYLQSIGMNGTHIGLIVSVGPIIAIVAEPFWGMMCDRFRIPRQILMGILAMTAVMSVIILDGKTFLSFALLYAVLHFFQSGVVPISDGMALRYAAREGIDFGRVRQWGAIGFALATLIVGLLAQKYSFLVIFYVYGLAQLIALLFLYRMDVAQAGEKVNIWKGLLHLIRIPRYILFLPSAFLIFGPINAHNVYFGLLYDKLGGNIAGIGLAFLLFAGSEAPFMKFSGFFIRRLGLERTILLAGLISSVRWFWYGTSPTPAAVLALFFVQGLSVGLYLASATQFVKENTPDSLRVTAIAIYTSMGLGLGSMASNLIGGMILDKWGIFATYKFFGLLTAVGLIPLFYVYIIGRKQQGTVLL